MKGYIKLYRKLLENPVFKNPELLQLFLYCLLNANHKRGKAFFGSDEIELDKGQFVTGRFELAAALGQNPSSTYKRLLRLSKLSMVGLQSNNKNTVVTVLNWEVYQSNIEDLDNGWTGEGQQMDKKRTGEGQEKDTNKNVRSIIYSNIYNKDEPPAQVVDKSKIKPEVQPERELRLINGVLTDVTGLSKEEQIALSFS